MQHTLTCFVNRSAYMVSVLTKLQSSICRQLPMMKLFMESSLNCCKRNRKALHLILTCRCVDHPSCAWPQQPHYSRLKRPLGVHLTCRCFSPFVPFNSLPKHWTLKQHSSTKKRISATVLISFSPFHCCLSVVFSLI